MARRPPQDRYKEIRHAKVHRDFTIERTVEAGIVLRGTEVKSIRAGQAQISESFARIDRGRVFLYHAHIAEYAFGNRNNHNPYRPRELLLHRREIHRLQGEMQAGGRTLVPTRMYFKNGLVKVELALCKGKKMHDRRDDYREATDRREIERAMKSALKR
jgi:SsrA-binding protein